MSEDLVGFLKESKLFAGFSPEQLEEVVLHMNPTALKLKSGDRVFKKGDPADRAWLIQSGKLKIKRASLRSPFRHMILRKGSVTGIQASDSGIPRISAIFCRTSMLRKCRSPETL